MIFWNLLIFYFSHGIFCAINCIAGLSYNGHRSSAKHFVDIKYFTNVNIQIHAKKERLIPTLARVNI